MLCRHLEMHTLRTHPHRVVTFSLITLTSDEPPLRIPVTMVTARQTTEALSVQLLTAYQILWNCRNVSLVGVEKSHPSLSPFSCEQQGPHFNCNLNPLISYSLCNICMTALSSDPRGSRWKRNASDADDAEIMHATEALSIYNPHEDI